MKSFFGNFKKLFGITAVLVFFLSMFLPSLAQATEGPHFAAELPLFDGINVTKKLTYMDPVTGDPGDNIAGLVYIHNDVRDTTANNTRVKVTLPSQTSNKSAVLSETTSADNAASISDNLTVNLSGDANINYVAGSAKLFKVVDNKSVEIPFPNGDGNNLVTTGVNIGNIQGCFEFVHFVSFIFKTTPKEQPPVKNANFEILKTVRNVSANEKDFVKSNFAKSGDILEYKIDFQNIGDAAADVFIKDQIPAKTTFIPGSVSIERSGDPKLSDEFVGEGVSISSVNPGEKIIIKFRVKVNADCKDNETLINTVTLFFNKISISDTAKTTVKVTVLPTPPTPVEPTPLPVSGPVETASAMISLSGMGIFGFLKYRKYMALKETKIISQLLSK